MSEIWHLIDPSLAEEPTHTIPFVLKVDITGETKTKRDEIYGDAVMQYNTDYKEYRERKLALIQTLKAIQTIISSDYLVNILDKETPYQALKTLKEAIQPDNTLPVVSKADTEFLG